jgi:hypothetical protein
MAHSEANPCGRNLERNSLDEGRSDSHRGMQAHMRANSGAAEGNFDSHLAGEIDSYRRGNWAE